MQFHYPHQALPKKSYRQLIKKIYPHLGRWVSICDLSTYWLSIGLLVTLTIMLSDWQPDFVAHFGDRRISILLYGLVGAVSIQQIYGVMVRPMWLNRAFMRTHVLQNGDTVTLSCKADGIEVQFGNGMMSHYAYSILGEVYETEGFVVICIGASHSFFALPPSAFTPEQSQSALIQHLIAQKTVHTAHELLHSNPF